MKKETIFVPLLEKTESRDLDYTRRDLTSTHTQSVIHGGFYGEPLATLRSKVTNCEIKLAHFEEHRFSSVLTNLWGKDRLSIFKYPNFCSIIFHLI